MPLTFLILSASDGNIISKFKGDIGTTNFLFDDGAIIDPGNHIYVAGFSSNSKWQVIKLKYGLLSDNSVTYT